ncbi:hypothetical protein JCM16418A_12730 [Paenibacillus pini]
MMLAKLRNLFVDRCPDCKEVLIVHHDPTRCVKSCPQEHYSEEIYSHLHVRIVYRQS